MEGIWKGRLPEVVLVLSIAAFEVTRCSGVVVYTREKRRPSVVALIAVQRRRGVCVGRRGVPRMASTAV